MDIKELANKLLGDQYKLNKLNVYLEAGYTKEEEQEILSKQYPSLSSNILFRYLKTKIDEESLLIAFKKYQVGTSKSERWKGACIFWDINEKGIPVSYKMMQYNNNGKRVRKEETNDNYDKIYTKSLFDKQYVFFGRHLYKDGDKRPICIVESEKTAIVASIAYPTAIWMAASSCRFLTQCKLEGLPSEHIHLFPDADAHEDWIRLVQKLPGLKGAKINSFIRAYDEEKGFDQEFDLCDYILFTAVEERKDLFTILSYSK